LSNAGRVAEQVSELIADVDQFLSGTMTIDRLSTILKVRIAALQALDVDIDWVEELRSLRNRIEYVNAFWLESGRDRLEDEEMLTASEAALAIKALLLRNDSHD